MSHRKPVKIRRSSKVNKRLKNNNIVLLKLIDPIVQSILIIYFIFCLDSEFDTSYRTVLLIVVAWQLLSAFLNFFLKDPKLLRMQRMAFVIVDVIYMMFFFYFERSVKEKYIKIIETDVPNIPVHQAVLMAGVVVIAFWYNIICYGEIKNLLAGSQKSTYR